MKKIFAALLMLLAIPSTYAMDYSVGGGILLNMPDYDGAGVDEEGRASLQLGALGHHELNSDLLLRTGLLLTRKNFALEVGSNDIDVSLDYLTVPLTVAYKVNSTVNLIGGLNLAINVADDCDIDNGSCDLDDPETLVTPLVLGASFDFTDKLYGEATYERALNESIDNTEISSLVFNVFYRL